MRLLLRSFSFAVATALLGGFSVGAASAEDFPTRPISLIVPYNAGGQTDVAGRVIAEGLTEQLGQRVSVLNKPGGGGVVGTAELATSKPDGYTLGLATSTPMVQKPNISDTPYTVDSLDYICRVNNNPLMFAVKKGSAIKSVKDLVDLAKSGQRITYGSSGEASVQHIAMTRFGKQAGIELVHVPSTADTENLRNILADVLTGSLIPASVVIANADTIQPIGLMDTERLQRFPDVETFQEAGFDVTAAVWGILAAPKGLGEPVLAKLRKACGEAQSQDTFKEQIMKLGMEPAYLDGDDARAAVQKENEASLAVLKELGYAK
ncbi:Bug family tripartite tricarboxylate transporter substrate binding protein [Mesorhizobium sp. A556]